MMSKQENVTVEYDIYQDTTVYKSLSNIKGGMYL